MTDDLSTDTAILRAIQAAAEAPLTIDPATVNIDFESSSAQTIVVAPAAGKRLRITKLWLSCSANFVMLMKSGATTIGTVYGQAIDMDFSPPLELGEAEAFVLDSDIATHTYGGINYYEEDV